MGFQGSNSATPTMVKVHFILLLVGCYCISFISKFALLSVVIVYMSKKSFRFEEQEVIHGRKTIKIGYRRNVVREFEKLRKYTYDTMIFEDIPILKDINTCRIDGSENSCS